MFRKIVGSFRKGEGECNCVLVQGEKPVCFLCYEARSVVKVNYLHRHFDTKHGAKYAHVSLQEKQQICLIWYGQQCPDLNPIEHVWDQLKQRLDGRTPPPCDLAELHVALGEEWNALPQNNIMRLVRGMRRHCQAVIAANIGNTRY
uniref:Tc1-like transposase DDE domain-containing protein n=1 Tax=Periophthalmus magnuspinnatus TaxID=409849 RepID=A0A3B4A6M6_9GOBI